MIERFGPPSKMDSCPHGTLCKVANSLNKVEIYIQISHDENNPNWISLGLYNQDVSNEHIQSAVQKTLLPTDHI